MSVDELSWNPSTCLNQTELQYCKISHINVCRNRSGDRGAAGKHFSNEVQLTAIS